MRRARLAVALISTLFLLVAGCGAEEGAGGGDEIPIGVNIELTGPASLLGASYKNALELVVADINGNGVLGGKKLKLVVRDTKSDPAEATRVAKNLWDNEKIVAMVGPGVSPTSVPVAQEAERRQVPLVSMASSGAVVNPVSERRYAFKTSPNNDDMAAVQVREIAGRGLRKVAYLAPANAYGEASEGMHMVHPAILAIDEATATTPEVVARKAFFRDYSQRYGQFSGFASFAADALHLIVRAIEDAGSTDPRKIRDGLEGQRYTGLTGRFEFSDRFHGGVAKDALAVLTVSEGKWVLAS